MVEIRFSQNALRVKRSIIRQLLAYKDKPYYMAGGLPHTDTFPAEDIKAIIHDMLESKSADLLQYGMTGGVPHLREEISRYMARRGMKADPDRGILITAGAQQALELVAEEFVNPTSKVVTSRPFYLGEGGVLARRGTSMLTVPMTDDGMDVRALEHLLKEHKNDDIAYIYTVPTFDNPTGTTMPDDARNYLLELASQYDILVVEDNPYGDLRYCGQHLKTLYERDDEGRVIYLGTFSKIMSPGFRVGWAASKNEKIMERMEGLKQSYDLCTNPFGQYVIAEYMRRDLLEPHIEECVRFYTKPRHAMAEALDTYLPEGSSRTSGEGGLFFYATFPEGVDAGSQKFQDECLKRDVVIVPGTAFYDTRPNTARINFSARAPEYLREGVKRLSEVIREFMR